MSLNTTEGQELVNAEAKKPQYVRSRHATGSRSVSQRRNASRQKMDDVVSDADEQHEKVRHTIVNISVLESH